MKDNQLRKEFEEFRRLLMLNISCLQGDMRVVNSLHPCSNCKALFREEDLQRVEKKDKSFVERHKTQDGVNYYTVVVEGFKEETLFYCPSHKVPYDRIQDGKYYKDNVEWKKKK